MLWLNIEGHFVFYCWFLNTTFAVSQSFHCLIVVIAIFLTVVITVVIIVFIIISVVVIPIIIILAVLLSLLLSITRPIVDALFTTECMPHCRSCSPHNHYITNTNT